MANCIQCGKRYYLSDDGATLRVCSQDCLGEKVFAMMGPGITGDVMKVFEERDTIRNERDLARNQVETWKKAAEELARCAEDVGEGPGYDCPAQTTVDEEWDKAWAALKAARELEDQQC
jgi:hypothetical protein